MRDGIATEITRATRFHRDEEPVGSGDVTRIESHLSGFHGSFSRPDCGPTLVPVQNWFGLVNATFLHFVFSSGR